MELAIDDPPQIFWESTSLQRFPNDRPRDEIESIAYIQTDRNRIAARIHRIPNGACH